MEPQQLTSNRFFDPRPGVPNGAAGRVILPSGKPMMAANKPGAPITHTVEWPLGERGVRQGQ
jgi:hypothetical protein